jgi:hypothetical protein
MCFLVLHICDLLLRCLGQQALCSAPTDTETFAIVRNNRATTLHVLGHLDAALADSMATFRHQQYVILLLVHLTSLHTRAKVSREVA